jgi:hypothetical protein
MPPELVRVDPIVERANTMPPAFRRWWTNGGRDEAWVHLAGELDVATTPRLERALREPAFIDSSGVHASVDASIAVDVVDGDIHAVEPSVEALMCAFGRSRATT